MHATTCMHATDCIHATDCMHATACTHATDFRPNLYLGCIYKARSRKGSREPLVKEGASSALHCKLPGATKQRANGPTFTNKGASEVVPSALSEVGQHSRITSLVKASSTSRGQESHRLAATGAQATRNKGQLNLLITALSRYNAAYQAKSIWSSLSRLCVLAYQKVSALSVGNNNWSNKKHTKAWCCHVQNLLHYSNSIFSISERRMAPKCRIWNALFYWWV